MSLRRRFVITVAVAGGGLLAWGGIDTWRHSRLDALDKRVATAVEPLLEGCHWERPVLGGEARDCNAAEKAKDAVEQLFVDAPEGAMSKGSLLECLEQNREPPKEIAEFVATHATRLDAVRDATRCSWACVPAVWAFHYRRGTTLEALELALLDARPGPADGCSSVAIDVLRVLQDRATGIGELGLYSSVEARLEHEARRTVLDCAAAASPVTLQTLAEATKTLATHPTPVGDALAFRALTFSSSLAEAAVRRTPASDAWWIQRGVFIDAAEDLAARVSRFRTYRDDDFPAAFDRLPGDLPPRRWVPFGGHADAREAVAVAKYLPDILITHARTDRALRLLAIAVAARRDRERGNRWPSDGPAELRAPELRDPLTGEAFGWSLTSSGASLAAKAARDTPTELLALPEPQPRPARAAP